MLTEHFIIVGAGGHSKVVISAVRQTNMEPGKLTVADDEAQRDGQLFCGLEINTPVRKFLRAGNAFHIAIGSNGAREHLYNVALSCNCKPVTVIHPNASIAPEAEISSGVFAASGALIAPQARVECGVIINHGAVVDHDCVVGGFSHIGPNATLGGGVVVGNRVMVGAGANILPFVNIGDNAVIAAGAVVINDVQPGETVIGVPAKVKQDGVV